MLTTQEFIKKATQAVYEYTSEYLDETPVFVPDSISEQLRYSAVPPFEVLVVQYCKTLQNHKVLLSTTVPNGMYYEVTYNGDKDEIYLDVYRKVKNAIIK